MKWKNWLLWVLPFAALGAALLWSYQARTTDLRPIASPPMMAAARAALWTQTHEGAGVSIYVSPAPTTAWANDRLPEWAKADFSRCVEWETDYHVIYNVDRDYLASGSFHGWVAVSESEETWILELTQVNVISGETATLIDAWDGPSQDDGT